MRATEPIQETDGWTSRVQHYTPKDVDCPDMIRAFIGDTMFAVSDEQRWNTAERPLHLHFFIRPSFLSNLSRTFGELSLQQCGADTEDEQALSSEVQQLETSSAGSTSDPDCCEDDDPQPAEESACAYVDSLSPDEKTLHIVSGETKVSILTLGWFIERAIVHNLRKFYEKYPATVVRFRKKLYDDFAQGDTSVPISVVIDRFLESENKLKEKLATLEDVKESDASSVSDSTDSMELKEDVLNFAQATVLPESAHPN
ncbi:hypothetical protein FGB62_23g117 [Gracilaria domingensis]|nr:hypothetical protein FGB62_23g117 [Gracilaria domingensis]